MATDLNNPEYWRFRSRETRAIAEEDMTYADTKAIMLKIADDYDRIAKMTEERK